MIKSDGVFRVRTYGSSHDSDLVPTEPFDYSNRLLNK